MICPLVTRRRPLPVALLLGALALASSAVGASQAPPAQAETSAHERAAPAAQDPLDKLRQKLAARLGASPAGDGGKPNVVSIALRPASAATPGTATSGAAPARSAATARTKPASAKDAAKGPLSHDGAGANWGYEGGAGPAAWSTLRPEFARCSSGARQSPIDIQGGIKVDLEPVQFDYKPSAFRVLDTGHTVQVNVAPGNSIEVGGRRFELVQFHFHRPSEERIDGRQFDMVAHLVHQDLEGRLAVVAVLLEHGSAHALVQSVWNNLPLEKGEEQAARAPMNVADLLPVERSYFTYMGSLTTPPCSEGVLWMVMKTPVAISPAQIDIFARLYPMNARPIQASAGRLIKQSN